MGALSWDDFKVKPDDDKMLDGDRLFAAISKIGGPDVFFVKLRQYSEQNEYRFIWNVFYDVSEAVFVTCPDAVKCCEKVTNA
jgi:hypothetical protein